MTIVTPDGETVLQAVEAAIGFARELHPDLYPHSDPQMEAVIRSAAGYAIGYYAQTLNPDDSWTPILARLEAVPDHDEAPDPGWEHTDNPHDPCNYCVAWHPVDPDVAQSPYAPYLYGTIVPYVYNGICAKCDEGIAEFIAQRGRDAGEVAP